MIDIEKEDYKQKFSFGILLWLIYKQVELQKYTADFLN